jgi:Kdo2-lipid IVA lauroyltransferase/acyltransferase
MSMPTSRSAGRRLKAGFDAVVGWFAVALLKGLRAVNRPRMANMLGRMLRTIGPWLPEHRVGRANLGAAFPDKSPQEIEAILAGVWDNLGRFAAEFAHIDRLTLPPQGALGPGSFDVTYEQASLDRFDAIRASGQPGLFFAAHLANWEIPAVGATFYQVPTNLLFRRPNIGAVGDAVLAMRAGCMGTLIPAGLDAPVRLANALQRGEHVGMLVDQHYVKGVDVVFFGRWVKANPLIAQLARHTGAPVHGVRMVRLPDGNHFWGELTDAIVLPRDAAGAIDVQGAMQAITSMIEGWVREHPEQWLWLHRRWR